MSKKSKYMNIYNLISSKICIKNVKYLKIKITNLQKNGILHLFNLFNSI